MASTRLQVRADESTKKRAAKTKAAMGLSVSRAVQKLPVRTASKKALPFQVEAPNPTTFKAMRSADQRKGKRASSAEALFEDLGL